MIEELRGQVVSFKKQVLDKYLVYPTTDIEGFSDDNDLSSGSDEKSVQTPIKRGQDNTKSTSAIDNSFEGMSVKKSRASFKSSDKRFSNVRTSNIRAPDEKPRIEHRMDPSRSYSYLRKFSAGRVISSGYGGNEYADNGPTSLRIDNKMRQASTKQDLRVFS